MKYLLALMVLFACGAAHADDIKDEWKTCNATSECMVATGACNYDVAINKSSLEDLNEFVAKWEACKDSGSPDPDATAKCNDHKCVLSTTGK